MMHPFVRGGDAGLEVPDSAVGESKGRGAQKAGITQGAPRPEQSVGGGAGIRPALELGAVPAFSRPLRPGTAYRKSSYI